MKTLIIYFSAHHGNTEKVALHICKELNYDCVSVKDAEKVNLDDYNGVIFGSGVYAFSMSKQIIKFVESNVNQLKGKKLGLILTSGILNKKFVEKAEKTFNDFGLSLDKKYHCLGFDTFGPLRFIGGINKKHPDSNDLEIAAKTFSNF